MTDENCERTSADERREVFLITRVSCDIRGRGTHPGHRAAAVEVTACASNSRKVQIHAQLTARAGSLPSVLVTSINALTLEQLEPLMLLR